MEPTIMPIRIRRRGHTIARTAALAAAVLLATACSELSTAPAAVQAGGSATRDAAEPTLAPSDESASARNAYMLSSGFTSKRRTSRGGYMLSSGLMGP